MKRILIVDDLPSNIKTLNEILRADYRISVATSGVDALKIASISPPDLVLLDIMMPEMDGYEVCKKLKEQEASKDIPIIFVTAMSEVADETTGLNLGAVDFISKPFSPPIVQARVQNHLRLKMQHDQLKHSISILEHQAEILQQKAELGIQSAGLAHDINNVLAAAMAVDMIPELIPDDFDHKDLIDELVRGSVNSLRLGQNICQGYTSFLHDLDEEENIQSLLPLLTPLDMYGRKFKGELLRDFAEDTPPILCKGYQVKRVIINLFANACQAIDKQDRQLIATRLWSDGDHVYFSITDNGAGISAEIMPHIFKERFTTKKRGTGLGLFMVKDILKAHNAAIEVDSKEGEGATFTIIFPAARKNAPSKDIRGLTEKINRPTSNSDQQKGGSLVMPLISWNESFSVNDNEIDEQHQRWIEILNNIHDIILGNADHDKAEMIQEDTIKAMYDYANYHFRFEEEYLEKINYPEAVEHRRRHKDFAAQIYNYLRDIESGEIVLSTEIIAIIRDWLVNHILGEDKKYAAFAAEKK